MVRREDWTSLLALTIFPAYGGVPPQDRAYLYRVIQGFTWNCACVVQKAAAGRPTVISPAPKSTETRISPRRLRTTRAYVVTEDLRARKVSRCQRHRKVRRGDLPARCRLTCSATAPHRNCSTFNP